MLALLAALAACTGSEPAGPSKPAVLKDPRGLRPNIVIVVTDDQRADEGLRTMPETRRIFAEGGVTLTEAYAPTPLCCPARASIYTGLYTHNHGVRKNRDSVNFDATPSLQHYLQDAGYKTALVGKYLTNFPLEEVPPFFDRWVNTQGGYYDSRFNVQGEIRSVKRYHDAFIGDRSVEILQDFERTDAKPWMILIATEAPHEPYQPQARYRDSPTPSMPTTPATEEADTSDKQPLIARQRDDLRGKRDRLYQQQYRTLMSVDDTVGRVFDTLEELGEERDTLAFFLSDNGFLLGEHGLFAKRLPYEASIKIPMFVRWPGVLRPGVSDDRLVANVDIAPTVLQAAGVEAPSSAPIDGRSLFETDQWRDRLVLEQYENWSKGFPDWASTLTRDYQYVEYYGRDGSSVIFREYYDLIEDPWRLDNLLAGEDDSHDPDVAALAERLRRDIGCSGADCP